MLPETSRTRVITRSLFCSRVTDGTGRIMSGIGGLEIISVESLITSHVLRKLHILFCRFGASVLCVPESQKSVTWKTYHSLVKNVLDVEMDFMFNIKTTLIQWMLFYIGHRIIVYAV